MQKYEKVLLISAIVLLTIPFLAFPVTSATGTEYLMWENPTFQSYASIKYTYPNAVSGSSILDCVAYYGNFQVTTADRYLTTISILMYKVGSPTAHINCVIQDSTGTTLETASNTIEADSLSETYDTFYNFTFSDTLELQTSIDYRIMVYLTDAGTLTSSNYVRVCRTTSTGDDYGQASYYSGAWHTTDHTINAKVYASTEATGEPLVTPTPAPTATAAPPVELTTIWTTVGSLIGLIVPLMVVVLPAFFGYKYAGAWGFLAGINIGAILAYVILGAATFPLWGIVVILILDALLLFGKVGFHS